jgi:hypothetical protein
MRYELVVLDAGVLDWPVDGTGEAALRELTDLGATLGLVSDLPEPMVRAALGRAKHYLDALDCGPPPSTPIKVLRIAQHLEFSRDRTLLVTGDVTDIAAVAELGIASAAAGWLVDHAAISIAPSHVVAQLLDVADILAGRPTLKIVR